MQFSSHLTYLGIRELVNKREKEKKERRRKGKRIYVKGRTKGRKKKEKKYERKQEGQTKSKCYKQIMYLDTMHCRLQLQSTCSKCSCAYQCFINILQLPAARISYQYNSLSKTLLRRVYIVLLFTKTLVLLGVCFVFLQT